MGSLIEKTFETKLLGRLPFEVKEIIPVRVRDIILDIEHPEIKSQKFAGIDGIGVVKYIPLDQTIEENEDTTKLPFAFPINNFNTTLPLKNEVVLLIKAPRGEETIKLLDYYISVVGLFNDINHIPSSNKDLTEEEDPGYGFKENEKIRPIHPFNGDTIIQSRLGSSIRFTGAKSPGNSFTTDSNANRPLLIVSNGHQELDEKKLYIEDVNKDSSSIYLCSNHRVPLEQSRSKYAGAKSRPVSADQYKGNQIILNSGRMFFNSKEEDIQFSSQKSFGVTAQEVFLDGKDYIGLDAKKIYLGEQARLTEAQPVIKGVNLELFLASLLTSLQSLGNALTTARTAVDQQPITSLNLEGPSLVGLVNKLAEQINPRGESVLKSTKVYTE